MIVQVSEAARLLLILWIAILSLKMLFWLFKSRKTIDIQSIERAFKRAIVNKRYFLCRVVLFLAVYACIHFAKAHMIPQLQVGFTYEDAAKGQTPNKTRFNESEILSTDIMEKIIQKGNLNMTAEELSECFTLNSFFDEKKIDEETAEAALKISTEYRVVFTDRIYYRKMSPRSIMGLLAEVYEEEFKKLYIENDSIFSLELDATESMEYLDIADYLHLQARKLKRYFENCVGEKSALSGKIETYIEVELERFRSYVLEHGLFKRNEEYKMRMEHINRILQLEYDKDIATYDIRTEMMGMYNTNMTDYVLVPTYDPDGGFYMSRTKVGVDYFADEADEFSKNAKSLLEEIENNDYIKHQAESAERSSASERAEEQIGNLEDELKSLSAECQEYCDSFFENKRNKYGNGYLQLDVIEVSMESIMSTIFRGTLIFIVVLCSYLVISEIEKMRIEESMKMQGRKDETDG